MLASVLMPRAEACQQHRPSHSWHTGQLGIEETGLLWGSMEWAVGHLWNDGFPWNDDFLWNDSELWDDELWDDNDFLKERAESNETEAVDEEAPPSPGAAR